jgi:hypothetical protein
MREGKRDIRTLQASKKTRRRISLEWRIESMTGIIRYTFFEKEIFLIVAPRRKNSFSEGEKFLENSIG